MLVSVHLLHVLVQGGVSSGCHIGYEAVGDVHKIQNSSNFDSTEAHLEEQCYRFLSTATHLNAYSHHSGLHI